MATIKVKFRASTVVGKEGVLFYRVIHHRVARQFTSGHRLYSSEWDEAESRIIMASADENRQRYLAGLKLAVDKDLQRFQQIIAVLEQKCKDYTADEVGDLYLKRGCKNGFIAYGRELVKRLEAIGKVYTAETYTAALNSFARFRDEKDIPLDEVDTDVMGSYESYLKTEGLCANSSSYYMRNLRAIYNRAVDEDCMEQRFPFRHVYTGIAKTVKRAIPLKCIKRIKNMDLSYSPDLDYARDMFMVSFYTRGMSIIDMAYLRKTDLVGSILSYRRKKTGQQLFIRWEQPMQEILDKYDTGGSPFLLPIIDSDRVDIRKRYRSRAHFINEKLKQLGRMIGLSIPLTMYVARHCWASVARSRNIPLSVISEGMGHDSERTTQIYLASLDTAAVDKANRIILDLL